MTNIIIKVIVVVLLLALCQGQYVTPLGRYPILPYDPTQGAVTNYGFYFHSDTDITDNAWVKVVFPTEFDARTLALFSGCLYRSSTSSQYSPTECSVSLNTFTIRAETIIAGNLSVVINGVTNPVYSTISSQFTIATLFKKIQVTSNTQFGQTPFSASPTSSSVGTVINSFNTLIEQGSSWIFTFTPSITHSANSSIRFIFPNGFTTNKIVCNVTGLFNSIIETRVLPSANIYDCLNVNMALTAGTSARVVVSGVVNPKWELTASNFKVQVLQGNGIVILETISVTGSTLISHKDLNVTMKYPNLFRNNSCVYTFYINVQSNLNSGDYIVITWSGNWTFFLNETYIVTGVNNSTDKTAVFSAVYNSTTVTSTLYLTNFSSILVSQQVRFFVSLRTPLNSANYNFLIETRRSTGTLVENYQDVIAINDTTAYIKQLRMHPVHQSVKLPVGTTGPLEIVLGLNYVLPNTDVLTFGRIDIVIEPQIPLPPTNLNGVVQVYFFGNIPCWNYTYDVSNPLQTKIVIFTPKDFVFASSEIPIMVTTEGYVNPSYQGITIDTLVKRYLFKIMFYASYKSLTDPTEVLFTEWIPDPVPLSSLTCTSLNKDEYEDTHLVCTFTTPSNIDLCANGHIHLFRVEFMRSVGNSAWDPDLGWTADQVYDDYPCLMWGPALSADPYVKCDLITYLSGPYALEKTYPGPYVNIYGFSLLPGGSTLTFEIPRLSHQSRSQNTQIRFTINEETWGMRSPYVELYSQTLTALSSLDFNLSSWSVVALTYSFADPTPNKLTTLTVGPFSLSSANPQYFVLELDQTAFPDIGRSYRYTCGSHLCSKFNKPIQYIVVYTQSNVGSSSITLTFPNIMTPAYAGTFTFKLRAIVNNDVVNKYQFNVAINTDTMLPATFQFDPLYESTTTLYPSKEQYYKVSWTLKNPLPASTSSIKVTFNNFYTISTSAYCALTVTGVTAADSRGLICDRLSSTEVKISNLAATAAGAAFTLGVKLTATSTAGTISPTINIITYYTGTTGVDSLSNQAHTNNPISNTNLKTMSTFTVDSPQYLVQRIRKGYFGPLEFYFQITSSSTGSNGYYTILTLSSEFSPVTNVLNLPFFCAINNIRYACSYTINPLTITITHGTGVLSTSNMTLYITTDLLEPLNGINYPANAGRYLLQMEVRDYWGNMYEKSEHYIDIMPDDVPLFNATYAHRDTTKENLFTFNFRTGSTVVPAYNDATAPGRIYIGFPTQDSNSNPVFDNSLGFSTGIGTEVPCWFNNNTGTYVQSISITQVLACRLRPSAGAPTPVWVEIINFQAFPANGNMQLIMGKITNPATINVDINFILKINTRNPTTETESPLYEAQHNMFIDMRSPSITLASQTNSASTMFEPGAKVGDTDKYIIVTPYTPGTFTSGDWFIVDLDPSFQMTKTVDNCLTGFYLTCIVFPTVNWLAVQIGNGTIIPLYQHIDKLPLSISRTDTTYKCYNFLINRWTHTLTYTITAANRWKEIQGTITSFSFAVIGRQEKIQAQKKSVEVLIGFRTTHIIPANGCIQIKFPSNTTLVPAIKPHCRSAITMGSKLYGQNAAKTGLTNLQGQVGCYIQYTSSALSWIITGNDELAAGSQVYIQGVMDMPLVSTTNLGTGYIVTYIADDGTNTFANSRIIDYTTTTFLLSVNTTHWSVDETSIVMRAEPLRASFTGDLNILVNAQGIIYGRNGYVMLYVYRQSEKSQSGGFSNPSNPVCTIHLVSTGEKYGCYLTTSTSDSNYVIYYMEPYEDLAANTDYYFRITSQDGDGTEGIPYPTAVGTYKIEAKIKYTSSSTQLVNKNFFIDVVGSQFNLLKFYSTVTLPGQKNLIMVELTPSSTIATNQQLVIEFPTISIDGINYFDQDLGMGYVDYSDLVYDIYDTAGSGISSMRCKVYVGQRSNHQPVKIICSDFNTAITTSNILRFGFWVTNPTVTRSLAIPITIYSYDQVYIKKNNWNFIERGCNIIMTSTAPLWDFGNFALDIPTYQTYPVVMSFTARNTAPLLNGDLYIVKINFDPRQSGPYTTSFKYNAGFGATGTLYIMRNCQTYVLKVGATSLTNILSASTTLNAQIRQIYTPYWKLSTTEATIVAYASYLSSGTSQKITHKETFPALSPKETPTPLFSFSALHSNTLSNQNEDYKFDFKYTNSGTSSDIQFMKMVSIHFPAATVNDFGFTGQECIEGVSSAIEVLKCVIDVSNRVIWITPVESSSYVTGNLLSIQTRNLAIKNPGTLLSVNANSFQIRIYSWNTAMAPTLLASSLDHVYLRHKSSIASAVTTYTSQTSPPHTTFQIKHRRSLRDDWEPSSDVGTSKKVPFRFKFKAMASFGDLSSTGNYHSITLNHNGFYTYTSATTSFDMKRYVPTCYLNEVRILSCSISSNTITMSFQQAITSGSQNSVKFSVLDPLNEQDDGFRLNTVAAGSATEYMTLTFNPYGATSYYIETEPVHLYYRLPSAVTTYPHFGITAASIYVGSYVVSSFNFIEFSFTFSRTDFNGLIIEIPVVDPDGDVIYTNPKFLGLPSGSKIPCSVGFGANVNCFYETGDSSQYGTPTRIYVSHFATGSSSMTLRMLLTNPDNVGTWPTINVKLMGGSFSAPNIMGDELMGRWGFNRIFQTLLSNSTYYITASESTYSIPDKPLGHDSTTYNFYNPHFNFPANTYVIIAFPLSTSTYGQHATFVPNSGTGQDYFIVNYAPDNRVAYVMRKWTSAQNVNFYIPVGYFKAEHFLSNSQTAYIFMSDGYTRRIDYSIGNSQYISARSDSSSYYTSGVNKMDLSTRQVNTQGWNYLEINMASYTGMNSHMQSEPADYVLNIQFDSGLHFSSMSGACSILQGISSKDQLVYPYCEVQYIGSRYHFIIRKFNFFSSSTLKIHYQATNTNTNPGTTTYILRMYGSSVAYNSLGGVDWPMARTWITYTLRYTVYFETTARHTSIGSITSNSSTQLWNSAYVRNGYVRITSLSSSQITFQMSDNNAYYPDSGSSYYQIYRFYVQRLVFSGGCSLSGWTCTVQSNNQLYIERVAQTNWGAGATWSETVYVTISGDVSNAQSLFVSMIFNTYRREYQQDAGLCGTYSCQDSSNNWVTCTYYCWVVSNWRPIYFGHQDYYYSTATSGVASGVSISAISQQAGVETQFSFYINNAALNIGPSYGNYLLFQFTSGTWTSGNMFKYTYSNETIARVDCQCVVASSITINYQTSYQSPACYRMLPFGAFTNTILKVELNIPSGQDARCYFPGFTYSTSSSVDGVFRVASSLTHRRFPSVYWNLRYQAVSAISVSGTGSNGGVSVYQPNNFLSGTSIGSSTSNGNYYLRFIVSTNINQPAVYIALPAPIPNGNWCGNSNYLFCRVYTTYYNRMLFVVNRHSSTSISDITFSHGSAATLPNTKDFLASNLRMYIGWTYSNGNNNYYFIQDYSRDHSNISTSTPTLSRTSTLMGSTLSTLSSTQLFSISMSGYTLYGWNKRAAWVGSYGSWTFTNTNVSGCSVWITDNMNMATSPVFCTVSGSNNNTVLITTRNDLTSSGTMFLAINTVYIPTSYTASFSIQDKYRGASDYSLTISTSTSNLARVVGGYTVLQPSYVVFRRPSYNELRTDMSPLRIYFSNAFDYVYNKVSPSNSHNFYLNTPTTGISSGLTYYCILKEYVQGAFEKYTQWYPYCEYSTTNQIRIWTIPNHIMRSTNNYELTVYKIDNANNCMFPVPTTDTYLVNFYSYSGGSRIYRTQLSMKKYQQANPITISKMYILTREAGVSNSLYLEFQIPVTGTSAQEIEFKFNNLGLSNFQLNFGDELPCHIGAPTGSYGFTAISGRSIKCVATSGGINKDTPLYIRVNNFASFTAGGPFKIAFDRFTNPSMNTLLLTPMDVSIVFHDLTTKKVYVTYFPQLYVSDSININTNPTDLAVSYSRDTTTYGVSSASGYYHYLNFNWPYSASGGVSEKILLKMDGGVLCCATFSNFGYRAQSTNIGTLWINTKINQVVMATPSFSATSTSLRISGIVNPYPYQVSLYNTSMTMELMVYNNYRRVGVDTFNQPAWSTYTVTSNSITMSSIASIYHRTDGNQMHSNLFVTYDITFTFAANDFVTRKVTYCLVTFTAGVGQIDAAYASYEASPYIINTAGNVRFYSSGGNWMLNISGITDSSINTAYKWFVRIRFLPTGGTITYSAQAFCTNGILQFSSGSSTSVLSSDGWNTSTYAPTTFSFSQRRYLRNYYELQRSQIYPAAGATTKRLVFRFKPPYAISEGESFSITLPTTSSTGPFVPVNTPGSIMCTIHPTVTTRMDYGGAYFTTCSYSSFVYSISAPSGGLLLGTEYTISILQSNQASSSFYMPTVPMRQEIVFTYNSMVGLQYSDVYILNYAPLFSAFSMGFSTFMASTASRSVESVTSITFTPSVALSAAVQTAGSETESMLVFEIPTRYFSDTLNIPAVFTADGLPYTNGQYYTHVASPSVVNANTRFMRGQQSYSYTPVRFSVTDYGAFAAGNSYTFKFPMILHPQGDLIPLTYKVSLVSISYGTAFPVVMGTYTMENKNRLTSGGTRSYVYAYFQTGSATVQGTMTLTLRFNSYDVNNGEEVYIKLNKNNVAAWTSYDALKTPSNTYYNTSEYYPNINLLRLWKTSGTASYTISLGSYPTSTWVSSWGFSWGYVASGSVYYDMNITGYSANIAQASGWTTLTLARTSGLAYYYVVNRYTVSWRSSGYTFPEGSYMILTFTYLTLPSPLADQCQSISGFPQPLSTTSILLCRRLSSNQIIITGYGSISANTALSITTWMRNPGSSVTENIAIAVTSANGNGILSGSASTINVGSSSNGLNFLSLKERTVVSLYKDTTTSLTITFTLSTYTLVSASNDYIYLNLGNWTVGTPTSQGLINWKYKVGSWAYWVPVTVTQTGSWYKIPIYANYSMTVGSLVTLWLTHVLPSDYKGIKVVNNQYNYFTIQAFQSSSIVEQQVQKVWIPTDGQTTFTVTPALTYLGAKSLYTISITPNVQVESGDYIAIEFPTNDRIYTFFANDLGRTFTDTFFNIGCREVDSNTLISSTRLTCRLYKGSSTTQKPAVIQVAVKKTIPAGTALTFVIMDITNPAANDNIWLGYVAKVLRVCDYGDPINLCAIYKATYYMKFNTGGTPTNSATGSISFSPNYVSGTPATHTYSYSYALAVGDFLKINYYPQVIVPETCTVAGHSCWTFPLQNYIIIKLATAINSPFSLAVQGMTNLYRRYTSNVILELWRSGAMPMRYQASYAYNTITTDPTSSTALGITFTPMLTSNSYQLRQNFLNIAKIELSYFLQNANVKSIWLVPPISKIDIVNSYCNATMESLTTESKPYPYRFICTITGSSWNWKIRLTKPASFPAWTAAHINRKIIIYLFYDILDSLATNGMTNWVATAYEGTTETTDQLISQGSGTFTIALYKSPHISSVDFHTTSFTSRTCTIGQQCMFYGYLLPSTEQSSYQINKMVFTLPTEFGYGAITSLDGCLMKGFTDITISSCLVDRTNSTVRMTYVPASYDHNYKLITLNINDGSLLFTTPQYPGTHYQMKAELYTTIAGKDVMIETSMVNITTVYGTYLSVPDIIAKIPLDGDAYGLFDIQFLVGVYDIPPAYPNTASNTITSQIVVIFANTFEFDLGTGYKAGDTVACVPVSGMTFNTMDRLTCKLYPSTSSITYPTIRITGYDKIMNSSTVRFRLAGLKTLPTGITDYLKVGIELIYYDYGQVTGNLYEPTSVVVGPPTGAISPYGITFTVTENSTNTVGELANYSFVGTINPGFSTVGLDDYVGIHFPTDSFERNFSINPQAICSIAASEVCLSFGKASIVYFQPAVAISAAALNFQLKNMIQAAYQFDYVNRTYTLFTLVNNKINARGTATMIKFAKFCKNISAIITSIDSSYGGDSQINYYFEFQLNHQLPTDGAVTITFPSVYPTLLYLSASCSLSGGILSSSKLPYCTIPSQYQINIYPNGVLLESYLSYKVTISNITNPNRVLTGNNFTVTSYYDSNIYSRKIISQQTFLPPQITTMTVKNCTFQTTLTASNTGMNTTYSFVLICPSFIKQTSEVKIYLPWKPAATNATCSSNTASLYSYQCEIKQEFIGSVAYSYLSVLVRNINAQKLFDISTTLTNPATGTYNLSAAVVFRGSVFLQGTTSMYVSALGFNSTSVPITVANFPQNAGQQAVYVFKLPYVKTTDTPATLQIRMPSVFTSYTSLSCSYRVSTQNLQFTYVDLMLNRSVNSLTCSSSGTIITVSNISTVFNASSVNSYFYYIIYGVINPSTYSVNTFTLSYQTSTTVYWTNTQNLTYFIGATPPYMQINKVMTTAQTYLVQTNYEFQMTAASSINIPSATPISVAIKFPSPYEKVWERMPSNAQVELTLGSTVFTGTVQLSTNTIYAPITIANSISFTSIKIKVIPWRNPNEAVNCQEIPVFKVALYNYRFNNVIVSTVLNNKDCVTFTERLYNVQVEGNSVIYSGSIGNCSILLEKPAQTLTITPSTTSSAITFEPTSITFTDYTTNVSTFMIKAAPSLTGNYTISFTKTEGSSGVFYNDIPNMNITVVAPPNPYWITFGQVDTKSIGLAIPIQITLSTASSNSFTLFYSHNCSTGFSLNPANSLLIPTNTNSTSITITYKGSVIPSPCAINFSLSYSNYNYQLTNKVLYVAGYISTDRSSIVPAMRMIVSTSVLNSTDVGKTIITSDNSLSERLKPIVYSLVAVEKKSNSANFTAVLTETGTLYYVIVPAGLPENVTHKQILNQNATETVTGGNSTALKSINIVTNFRVTGLSSQSQYKIAAYLSSSVGDSDIVYVRFNTSQASNGAQILIGLTSIQTNDVVLAALTKVLRVNISRLAVLTTQDTLNTYSTTHNSTIMNERIYVYTIVLAPSPSNETESPIEIVRRLQNENDTQSKLLALLPSFTTDYKIFTKEVLAAKPRVSKTATIPKLTFDSVTIEMAFWQEAYVYAVLVEAPSENLLSKQIIQGLNDKNLAVVPSRYISTQTNANGSVVLTFNRLNGNTSHIIHISAECVLPYNPRLAMTDSEVLHIPIKTVANLNLRNGQTELITVLDSVNKEMSSAVQKHIKENALKTNINSKKKEAVRIIRK